MKLKDKNTIGIILIVAGIILLGAYVWKVVYPSIYYNNKGESDTERIQDELYKKFVDGAVDIKDKDDEDYQYIDKVNPIAYMEIPKIDLKVVIAEGIEEDILKYAVGHFKETALPGQTGNCSLAGHRNYDTGEFFLKVDKLESGDDIIISTKEDTFRYVVTKSFVVKPEDTYVIDQGEDDIITLVTCTYDGKERLIVQGELKK